MELGQKEWKATRPNREQQQQQQHVVAKGKARKVRLLKSRELRRIQLLRPTVDGKGRKRFRIHGELGRGRRTTMMK
jgi:hypothetical protein